MYSAPWDYLYNLDYFFTHFILTAGFNELQICLINKATVTVIEKWELNASFQTKVALLVSGDFLTIPCNCMVGLASMFWKSEVPFCKEKLPFWCMTLELGLPDIYVFSQSLSYVEKSVHFSCSIGSLGLEKIWQPQRFWATFTLWLKKNLLKGSYRRITK